MKKPMRVAMAVLTCAAAALVTPVVTPQPALAVSRPGLTVADGRPAQATFPPIPGNAPTSGVLIWFPEDCESPDTEPPVTAGSGGGAAFCDNVPIDVVPPRVDENTPWFVDVEVSWVDPAGANDLDITLFDNGQVAKRDNKTGYTRFGEAATADNPERFRTYQLLLGRYNLVVLNYVGANTGYTVKLNMVIGEPFQDPFELLEDVPSSGSSGDGTNRSTGALSDGSGFVDDFGTSTEFGAVFGDLDSSSGSNGFDDLAASGGISDLPGAPIPGSAGAIAQIRPGPASGALMFVWLVLLPVAMAAGAATFVTTRSRRRSGLV